MKSMTGFGYREYQDEEFHCTVEIKSLNNRYLDIYVNLPPYMAPLEPKIRALAAEKVLRGRVEVNLRTRELEENMEVLLDTSTAKSFSSVLKELGEYTVPKNEEITLSHLLQMEGIIKTVKTRDLDTLWEKVLPLLYGALTDLEKTRTVEGEKTARDIQREVDGVKKMLSLIEKNTNALEEHITSTLRERFDQVMGDRVDEQRILAETAVLLVRFSIKEELSRLSGHLGEFEKMSKEEGAIGKKLDFLCQEINREINTIGSKSTILEINRGVVEAKNSLENIREQLRNVE